MIEAIVLPAEDWTTAGFQRLLNQHEIEAVVNLAGAGVRPGGRTADLFDANVELPVRLAAAGRGCLRAFVNIGSGAEYAGGAAAIPIMETAPLTQKHPYGLSKAAGGFALLQVAHSFGIAMAHLRLFGAYGQSEAQHRLLPSLARALRNGESVPLSDGDQVRDWLYEDDVGGAVAAAICALSKGHMASGFYNLGSGEGRSVKEFATMVAAAVGAPESLLHFGALPRREAEVAALVADPRKFMAASMWTPRYSFESGVRTALSCLTAQRRMTSGGDE